MNRLDVSKLRPDFGAEISGVELRPELDAALVRAIWDGVDEHSLLVFRNQQVTDDELLALSQRFGVPDGGVRRYPVQGPAPEGAVPSRWHSHGNIPAPRPPVLCCSFLRESPASGGEIEFAGMRSAFNSLDDAKKAQVAGLSAIHRFGSIAHSAGAGSNTGVVQPLVYRNPDNMRQSLFIGYHAVEVVGMGDDGRALLAELLEFGTQERFVYRHQWQPGDFLFWDLCALLHRTHPLRSADRRVLHEVILGSRTH